MDVWDIRRCLHGIGGLGVWAFNAQKRDVVGIVEKKEEALKGQIATETATLKGRVDTNKKFSNALKRGWTGAFSE